MKKYLFIIITLLTSLVATSCQDEDFGFSEDDVFKGAYKRNFEKEFGKIDPNQSWDFTSYGTKKSAATRAGSEGFVTCANRDGYYYIPNSDSKAAPSVSGNVNFAFYITDKTINFEIVPVHYKSGYEFHFNVVNENNSNIVSWEQGANTQRALVSTYANLSKNDIDGNSYKYRSKPTLVDISSLKNQLIYYNLYLDKTNSKGLHAIQHSNQSSLDKMMKIGSLETITINGEVFETRLIHCEDKMRPENTDKDNPTSYGQITFRMIGKKLPEVITASSINNRGTLDGKYNVTDYIYKATKVEKRYMLEDLGSSKSNDLDFNDIVVDVREEITYTVRGTGIGNADKGQGSERREVNITSKTPSQLATITNMWCVNPFVLTIGNTTFGKVTDPTNKEQTIAQLNGNSSSSSEWDGSSSVADYESDNLTFDIEGWNPATNNISLVTWRESGKGSTTIAFPETGTVPFMIATNKNVRWLSEGRNVSSVGWSYYTGEEN